MAEPAKAVFLSYASQDAEAAQRICDELRAAGVEVWFDRSELRGGDAWDQKIRREIHDCALFIPVISGNTAARHEGYFRLEWDLADQRTHMIARNHAFIVPVCVDATPENCADAPESFQRVQWARLPGGETTPAFVARIARLISPEPATASRSTRVTSAAPPVSLTAGAPLKRALQVALAVVAVAALGYWLTDRFWSAKHGVSATSKEMPVSAPSATSATASATKAFSPPPHSIAVLPFVNMSGDKEQEYFSDGLTEELLNSLSRINELQVAARTSSFSIKGKDVDLGTIARKLNVAALLEGSVRRSGNTIRVTAQLSNAVTGFHLWSQTYDRDLGDVLKLQSEIATSVANALKVTLLADPAAKIEVGGTRNAAALDAYLRGLRLTRVVTDPRDEYLPVAPYSEAIRLDPNYALAFAARSLVLSNWLGNYGRLNGRLTDAEDLTTRARADAERAITLAPTLGEAHLSLASFLETTLDFTRAGDEYERALALAPGNATVLYAYALHAAYMGRSEAALVAAQRSVSLDPLNPLSHRALGDVHWFAHRYDEAIAAYSDAIAVDPAPAQPYARRGLSYYVLGNFPMARSSCETKASHWESWVCLALTDEKLGLHREAEAEIPRLVQFNGDSFAYQFAQIYAQWGQSSKALDWLETAMHLSDSGFKRLKTDPLMDPLRKEPRFKAVERALRFPG